MVEHLGGIRVAASQQLDEMGDVHRRGPDAVVQVVDEISPLLLLPRRREIPLGKPQRLFGLQPGGRSRGRRESAAG